MKWTTKILLPVILFVCILSVGGVFASWNFYEWSPQAENTELSVAVKEFAWTGSEEMVTGETSVVGRFVEEINKQTHIKPIKVACHR